jgi:Ca-activated chloride channel family protein
LRFESPFALIALVLVPLAILGYIAFQRSRARTAGRFAAPALQPNLIEASPSWRRHVPAALLLVAVSLLLVGFARPHAKISRPSEEATAIVVIDNSRSMGATDVEPTRLAAAQAIARRFLDELPGRYRAGIVAFASRAQVVAAPTQDREFTAAALDALRIGEASAVGDAIATAVQLTRPAPPLGAAGAPGTAQGQEPPQAQGQEQEQDEAPPAVVFVISDGARDGGNVDPEAAVRQAREAHVPVFTALVGTDLGVVEVQHIGGFVERIEVPPDPDLLSAVAGQTGGRFFRSPEDEDLDAVYADLKSRLAWDRKDTEITVGFAAGAAVLLLASSGLAVWWFRRVT